MIVIVNGRTTRLSDETEKFIVGLSQQTGTPASEIVAAIVNGAISSNSF
jgi:predicted DNA-binding protein